METKRETQHSGFLDEAVKIDSELKEVSLRTTMKEALNSRVGNSLH